MIRNIVVRPIEESDDVRKFLCGNKDLEKFLKKEALKAQLRSSSATYLLFVDGKLAGFVTVVGSSIRREQQPVGLDGYNSRMQPVLLLARMAIDGEFQKHNLGTLLIAYTFRIAERIAELSGCVGITVDAKEDAKGFYLKHHFKDWSPDDDHFGFISIEAIKAHLRASLLQRMDQLLGMTLAAARIEKIVAEAEAELDAETGT